MILVEEDPVCEMRGSKLLQKCIKNSIIALMVLLIIVLTMRLRYHEKFEGITLEISVKTWNFTNERHLQLYQYVDTFPRDVRGQPWFRHGICPVYLTGMIIRLVSEFMQIS